LEVQALCSPSQLPLFFFAFLGIFQNQFFLPISFCCSSLESFLDIWSLFSFQVWLLIFAFVCYLWLHFEALSFSLQNKSAFSSSSYVTTLQYSNPSNEMLSISTSQDQTGIRQFLCASIVPWSNLLFSI
jgi:hypothetical protein